MKPLKFAISGVFYAFTLAWMLSYVKGHPRLVGLVSFAISAIFLAELAMRHGAPSRPQPVMMLVAEELKVVPTTVHIPLSAVPRALTHSLLTTTVRITAAALAQDFGIAAPRIAVAGLNPHAGEGGLIGAEEATVIRPAIDALIAEGIAVTEPGVLTREIVRQLVDDLLVVSEQRIEETIALALEIEKTVLEGAGAAGLAAVLEHPERFRGERVGVVLSGGNTTAVDFEAR